MFTRAHPTPEQLSTLIARLTALMGQDRIGRPAVVDSYRPGAFAMGPFPTEHAGWAGRAGRGRSGRWGRQNLPPPPRLPASGHLCPENVVSALRRCRHPVPARVAVAGGRPVAVTTDRRGFAGGRVQVGARAVADFGRVVGGGSKSEDSTLEPRRVGRRAQRRRGLSDFSGSGHRRVVHRCDRGLDSPPRRTRRTRRTNLFKRCYPPCPPCPRVEIFSVSSYIELHTASAFSFLQGASLPEALVDRAADLGYPALALLDRDGVYGAPAFTRRRGPPASSRSSARS